MFDSRSVDVFNLKSVAFFVDQQVEQVEFNSSLVLTCKQRRYAADLQRKKTSLKMCLSTCPTWGQMILIHSCILILPRYSKLLGMLDRSAIKNSIPQLTWTKEMVGRLLSELKVVYRQILRDAPVSMKSPFSRQAHLGLYGLFILFLSQAPDCTICGMNQPCESDFFTAAEI